MPTTKFMMSVATVGLVLTAIGSKANAESNDAEIALLKQQLRMMEAKLDKLQKQTSANTTAAAKAEAKAEASAAVANAHAADYPVKGARPLEAIVSMPGNRPTI